MIGFDEVQRNELLIKVNAGDPDLKYDIEKTCWKAFWDLYRELVDLHVKEMMDSIEKKENKYKVDNSFMTKARQEAWRDLEGLLSGEVQESLQIDEIRTKLKSLSGNQ